MIAVIGNICLLLSLLASFFLSGFISYKKNSKYYRTIPLFIFLLVGIAFLGLMYAYITSDFSLMVVAMNSHTAKPLFYKIAGTWGNHEGSMMMFALFLTMFTALFTFIAKDSELKRLVIKSQSGIIFLFMVYILFASSPFILLENPPQNGNGLNPLLQDVGLATHPPILYLGYCGFSLALSFAVAALWQSKMTKDWSKMLRPWLMLSWTCLTLGIGLGSWWAYRELGWGGFWFWDPVENSSLLPWLAATALIHSVIVSEKRGLLRGWTNLLSILTFSLCLVGFFLVRSGVLTSVHSFASDPTRGVFILSIIVIVIGGALTLYAIRAHRLVSEPDYTLVSRESFILLNNIILTTLCGTVFLGTIYPILVEVLNDTHISVGTPYYNQIFVPIAMLALVFAALAPYVRWKSDDLSRIWPLVKHPVIVAAIGIIFAIYLLGISVEAIAMIFALWLSLATLNLFRKRRGKLLAYAMELGHMGLALLVISIAVTTGLYKEATFVVSTGKSVEFENYQITYNGEVIETGNNYVARKGDFSVSYGNDSASLYPEIRFYPVEQTKTTESAIARNYLSDIYLVMGDMQNESTTAIRLFYRPMINGLWIGCFMMAISGIISILARRKS